MSLDFDATRDAIFALHKEWGELVTLRRSVRDAPYDEAAEQALVSRLEQHRDRLHALRSAIAENTADPSSVGEPPALGRRSTD